MLNLEQWQELIIKFLDWWQCGVDHMAAAAAATHLNDNDGGDTPATLSPGHHITI